jgi:hypothetical protein
MHRGSSYRQVEAASAPAERRFDYDRNVRMVDSNRGGEWENNIRDRQEDGGHRHGGEDLKIPQVRSSLMEIAGRRGGNTQAAPTTTTTHRSTLKALGGAPKQVRLDPHRPLSNDLFRVASSIIVVAYSSKTLSPSLTQPCTWTE